MIKGAAIFTSGTVFGVIVGAAGGLIAGIALHEVFMEEVVEELKKASDKRRQEQLERKYANDELGIDSDWDEIVLDTESDATQVLESLLEELVKNGSVSVADLYELVGITSKFVDTKWGWSESDLSTATVKSVRHGHMLDLPKPHLL